MKPTILIKNNLFKKNTLLKNISLVIQGTALGQGMVFLLSPIITRIYSPEHFGLYTVYVALLGILASVAALRFDVAIPVPKKKIEGLSLCIAALISLSIFTLIIVLGIHLVMGSALSAIIRHNLKNSLWLLPISVFAIGLYNIMTYFMVRHRLFSLIGRAKMTQAMCLISTQITFGLLKVKSLGLILGQIVGHFVVALIFITKLFKLEKRILKKMRHFWVVKSVRRYWRFPVFSTPASLMNALGLYLPAIAISALYSSQIAGWYGLAIQVMSTPLGLIGQAVGQVYMGEGAALKNSGNCNQLLSLYIKTICHGLIVGFPFILIMILLGPSLFGFIFGSDWLQAGMSARILSIMLLLEFAIIGPSQNFALFNRQDFALYWNVLFILLNFSAFLPACLFGADYFTTLIYLALAKSIGYITMAFLNLYVLRSATEKFNQLCVE